MANTIQKHHRRSIRLPGVDYSVPGFYFVTICVKNREHLFGEVTREAEVKLSEMGNVVRVCWEEIPKHFPDAIVDEFVIMPNHVHGIIEIVDRTVGAQNFVPLQPRLSSFQHITPRSIGSIIRGFKIGVTKILKQKGIFDPVFQRNYFEHIVRDPKSLEKIRVYIRSNPFNWSADLDNIATQHSPCEIILNQIKYVLHLRFA